LYDSNTQQKEGGGRRDYHLLSWHDAFLVSFSYRMLIIMETDQDYTNVEVRFGAGAAYLVAKKEIIIQQQSLTSIL
jgi:hypothetical protein